MTTQKNIYFANLTKSHACKFTPEDDWLIAQITRIGQELTESLRLAEMAQKLLTIFQGHQRYQAIHRVCLAKLLYPSNEIMALSSQNHERVKENLMPTGYRCFVTGTGSLAKMRSNVIRVYRDTKEILADFKAQGMPPQRSIYRIYQMGFRSGVAISLAVGERNLGYLFFNSLEPGFFDQLRDEDYAIFSILQMLAVQLIELYEKTPSSVFAQLREHLPSPIAEAFQEQKLTEYLQQFFIKQGCSLHFLVRYPVHAPRFLYSPARLVYLIGLTLLLLKQNRTSIVLTIEPHDQSLICLLEHQTSQDEIAYANLELTRHIVTAEASLIGIYCEVTPYHFSYAFPADYVSSEYPEITYSI